MNITNQKSIFSLLFLCMSLTLCGADTKIRYIDGNIEKRSILETQYNNELAGNTELHRACWEDKNQYATSDDKVKSLLESGADPNAKNSLGETPLHIAANHHRLHAIRLLVKRGADINARDQYQRTPLQCTSAFATGYNDVRYEIVKLLLELGANPNNILWKEEISRNNFKTIKLLIQHGANINAKNNNPNLWHENPIYGAIDCRRSDILEFVLSKGACANVQNRQGDTPLHHLVHRYYEWWRDRNATINLTFYAQCLIDHGAYTDIKNNNGKTPLDVAKRHIDSYQSKLEALEDFVQYIINHPNPNPSSGNCIVQ